MCVEFTAIFINPKSPLQTGREKERGIFSKMATTKLKPSMREKKRYVVFEIIAPKKIRDYFAVHTAIMNSAQELLGQKGMANAGMMMLKDRFDPDVQKGVIRVGHKHVDDLRASLALVKGIEGQDVIVRSIGTSGILKKALTRYGG